MLHWLFQLGKRSLGERGERVAGRFLRWRGYRVLERSYRCPLGEIDLVCRQGQTIVIVEVKTRSSAERGEPWQAVDAQKQRRLTRLATYYLKANRLADVAVRFDVIAITWPTGWWSRPHIEHFESAFDAIGPWSV